MELKFRYFANGKFAKIIVHICLLLHFSSPTMKPYTHEFQNSNWLIIKLIIRLVYLTFMSQVGHLNYVSVFILSGMSIKFSLVFK